MKRAGSIACCCVLALTGLSFDVRAASDEAGAVRAVDEAMVEALNARDVERWLTHFAEDGAMWPHCEPRVVGKVAIRDYIGGFVSMPTFAVTHDLETIVVADSGDLAYITYTYEIGNPVLEAGKDLSVFRKDASGAWKLVIDMWSTDAPPCE